jgi:DNA-binding LacI/PurR family transcriptional regulator
MSIVSVAKRAGVSIATVSRVINDLDNVRGETAEQVRAAMRELGYTPPRVKRGPKSGRRRTLSQVLPSGQLAVLTLGGVQNWLTLPVMASVVAGITREAKALDVWAVLDEMPDPGQLSPIFRRREVDGAVVFCDPAGSNVSDLMELNRHVPVVWVMGGEDAMVGVDHVSPDNSGVGRIAYDYLAAHHCKNFAFITDAPSWPIMRLRAQAYANAARDDGGFVSNYLLNANSVQREAYGGTVCVRDTLDDLIQEFARRKAGPTGLFVPTDLLLTRLHPLLVQHGVWGKPDLTIVSCDNEEDRLGSLKPRPASIDIQGEEIGRLAVRQLVQRLQRPDAPPARVQLAPRLVQSAIAT